MRHLLILGETGAGKSTLTKEMVPHFRRVLVLDRHWEYLPQDGYEVVCGFAEFSRRIASDIRGEWRIAFRTDTDAEWGAAVALLYYAQRALSRNGEARETLVIAEEIGLFSSPQKLPDWLGALWNYGRHYNIRAVGVCRQDTETHSVLRLNSTLVFFRCTEITAKVAKALGGATIQRIAELPLLTTEEYRAGIRPRAGVNYVTYPDSGDVMERLAGRNRIHISISAPQEEILTYG